MNTSYPKEKLKILLLENIHPSAIKLLRDSGYTDIESISGSLSEKELSDKISKVHVVGIRSKTQLTETVLKNAERLIAVGAFCIGTNQIKMDEARKQGIAVFNSPFSNTRSVAELVIGLGIMLMRRVFEKSEGAHHGLWLKESKDCYEVRGKTLGIIGYGHIGSQVSVLAEALGMKVLFYDITSKLVLGNAQASRSIDDLLKKSDIITLHVPGTPDTRDLINAARLKKMKPGAVLVNLSRGDVMDVWAVKDALEKKHLGGLAVDVFPEEPKSNKDVFASPLQGLPNVILTPHIGGSTVEAQEAIGLDVAEKIIAFIESGSSSGSLTVPEISLPVLHNAHRILHVHRNVPGVLSQINGVLSKMKVNILGQYLKTNEEIGYVVLDIDKKSSTRVMAELKKVKHTIRTRSLY
ncbi:MAG: phosphoglycerate dehydrogenase [Bacteroidetes bacterium]|nr:phosphoglycerate dehydrogenase [Bacteroidota bacterium]MBL0095826.1 phosphoglycerate dehydrogenase [Bacteroidota bacterium]